MVVSEPPVSLDEKREALEAVLGSATFARSAQLRAFLRYVCDREMAGHAEELTEYQIAVDVLGRRKDFSLADDSSVRNRAYELRQRLEKYYTQEQPRAEVRIDIPRGGYVPFYTRHPLVGEETGEAAVAPAAVPDRRTFGWRMLVAVAAVCLAAGGVGGRFVGQSHPAAIVKEAWGPLAAPDDDLLICIATNLHMIVRPHIPPHPWRLSAPEGIASIYGAERPLQPGEPLYMEPAQLSVPLAELAAAADLAKMRQAFGGSYQLLPESEAPVAALRGRNSALIGSGTNSAAAALLLRNLPLTIDYNRSDQFAVIDQRKPAGQNERFTAQPIGQPVPSVLYGLISVITASNPDGKAKRTVVFSGSGSAGVQAAVEFFCSPAYLKEMKVRFQRAGLQGFPSTYQVVVRARTSGIRLISYEYAAHEVVQ